MLAERLLDVEWTGAELRPRYLTSRDQLWVEALLDRWAACAGLSRAQAALRLKEAPDRGAPRRARQALAHLLTAGARFEVEAPMDPQKIRAVVFEESGRAGFGADRAAVLRRAGARLGVDPDALDRALYADLPGARVLTSGVAPESAQACIERYNLELARGLLLRAEELRIRVEEHFNAVLRQARLQRLLCGVEPGPLLRLSGPLSLFRFTTKYGRAMAAWLPVLVRTPRWSLEATCVLGGRRGSWRADWRDPIGAPPDPLRRFDSRLEERLFRDLARTAPEWEVLREADPVQVGTRILTPDFTLVHRGRGIRVPVEVVGYWTADYLRAKLEALRALPPGAGWIVCVDTELGVRKEQIPAAGFLTFRGRVDARALAAEAAART